MGKNFIVKGYEDHPVTAYLNSLTSKSSKTTMFSALKSVVGLGSRDKIETGEVDPRDVFNFPWQFMDAGKMNALRAGLIEKFSPRSAAKMFSAVRGVMGACFDLELIDAEAFMRIQRVKGIKVDQNQKTGRRLTDGEIKSLAKICAKDDGPAGSRDDALIGLGITQGPRVGELVGFSLKDYDPETGDLVIQKGKGGKSRTLRANNSTKESLDEWISIRGSEDGPLFCRVKKGGTVDLNSISPQGLSNILKKRASQSGVEKFTAHDLRRTFITNGWAIGIPGSQLQMIAGHSSMATTASYDRGALEDALKNTSGRLHYPSMRRQG